jgi:multidrug efflux pump subunit AcrA (membrane-fusion protein)
MNTFLKIITPFFFLAFLLVNSTCKEPATETKAVMGTITESVYASLSIEPEDLYSVYAVNSGIIQSLFIKEGDTVQKNQVLAMISADNQKLNLDNASLNLEKSRENYQIISGKNFYGSKILVLKQIWKTRNLNMKTQSIICIY